LIIVGILAAIALPNLFANIQKSRGAEALASMGPMKAQIEACGTQKQSYASCSLALQPTGPIGPVNNFDYYYGSTCPTAVSTGLGVGGAATYCIKAVAYAGGADTGLIILRSLKPRWALKLLVLETVHSRVSVKE